MIAFIYDEQHHCHRRDTEEGTFDGDKTFCPVNGWGAIWETWQEWLEA